MNWWGVVFHKLLITYSIGKAKGGAGVGGGDINKILFVGRSALVATETSPILWLCWLWFGADCWRVVVFGFYTFFL